MVGASCAREAASAACACSGLGLGLGLAQVREKLHGSGAHSRESKTPKAKQKAVYGKPKNQTLRCFFNFCVRVQ